MLIAFAFNKSTIQVLETGNTAILETVCVWKQTGQRNLLGAFRGEYVLTKHIMYEHPAGSLHGFVDIQYCAIHRMGFPAKLIYLHIQNLLFCETVAIIYVVCMINKYFVCCSLYMHSRWLKHRFYQIANRKNRFCATTQMETFL